MRKTFRFLSGCAIAALMLGGLASCEDDPIVDDNNKVATTDVDQWMAVTVSAPKSNPFGRADVYEDGSYKESAIQSMHFFFFNDKGEPAASVKKITDLGEQLNSSNNVTKIASVVVKVSSSQGANLPTQTICFINLTNTQATALEGLSIDEIRNEVVESFANGNNFIMSNSVYFGTSPITGKTERICATSVVGKLFDSEQAAKDAITNGTSTVDIYVERLAAKVGLTLNATNIKGYELVYGDDPMNNGAYNKVTLKFTPEYWFVNAVSKEEYITKRYGTSKDNMKPTYEEIVASFNKDGAGMSTDNAWNAPTLYRSFWGCSPSYYTATYPSIAEDYTKNSDKYPINYYSYNDIKNSTATGISTIAIQATNGSFTYSAGTTSNGTDDDGKTTITGTDASGCLYVPETTTTITAIRSGSNNAATVASAVIVGQYSYKIGDTEHQVGNNDAFFIDTNRRVDIDITENGTTTKETRGVFYTNTTAALTAFAKLQDVVYSDNQGTTLCTDPTKFEFVHTSGVAARLFALQIPTKNVPEGLYYYDGEYKAITTANVDAVNARLIQRPGYINKYDNGHAMFTIPIHHLGWNQNLATGAPLVDDKGTYQWANMRIGDLGIVRNHVYELDVKNIGGLGTAIIDNQPIVPPVDYVEQWLAVKLNVLSWRVVPKQEVNL